MVRQMSESHSEAVLKLHKAMVELGDGMPAAEVVAALALTVAYASRHCLDSQVTVDQGLRAFNRLVLLEYIDPNSQMVQPK